MARKTTKTAADSKTENKIPSYKVAIKCQNSKQKEFVKSIKDLDKEICFGIGSAGTGKTFLSMATALSLLKDSSNEFNKIVIFLVTTESTKELQIGYLKGMLEDKILVYQQNSINTIEKIFKQ